MITKPKNIKIAPENFGMRLDHFLVAKLKISRSQVQKMIDQGSIVVSGRPPKKAGERIQATTTIAVTPIENKPAAKLATKAKVVKKPIGKVKIIASTPDYAVVEKPSGMLVHPTQAKETDTLVAWLLKKYPEIKRVGDLPAGRQATKNVRPGIVHRLDKEASGLLVVARTQKMFDHLKDQFKNRTMEKEYWALVHDKVAKDWDEINFPIARSESADRMAARPLAKAKYVSTLAPKEETETADEPSLPGEKQARTEFIVEKRFVNFTLLRVILHTGRMHQIRVHMLAYNHPIVGDPLYNQIKRQSKWDAKCGRLFLHSAKLGFTDLTGKKQTFESVLPNELAEFLKLLK